LRAFRPEIGEELIRVLLFLMVGEVYQNPDDKKGGISRPSKF
jgi:hypothetical protein